MFKIGEKVAFEELGFAGSGYVIGILPTQALGTLFNTYVIANRHRDCLPWHIAAEYNQHYNATVVITSRVYQIV